MYVLAVVESKTIIPSGIYYYPNVPLYCLVPWNADVCLFAIPFMAVGKYSKEMALIWKEHFEDSIRKKETILLCLAAAIFVIFGFFQICGVYPVDINMKYVHYSNFVLCILLPLSVGVILMKCSMALSNGGGYAATTLCEVGKASLTIMYTHLLIRDYIMIPAFGEKYSVLLWVFISCIIGVLIRILANKNTFTSMIILGKWG